MFTGIVSAVGTVSSIESAASGLRITIAAPYDNLEIGESVAVNGACLTVVDVGDGHFDVQAVVTTRGRTTIADWTVGRMVNLERALEMGDRLGGHIVQGHVDGVGIVTNVERHDDAMLIDVQVPPEIGRVSIQHGSITLDGVSLTINALREGNVVQVALIPHTRDHTTLGALHEGGRVHVEGDVIGKYVERLISQRTSGA